MIIRLCVAIPIGVQTLALSPLGESDFWTPMGSIGPQKSGRVDRRRRFLQAGRAG